MPEEIIPEVSKEVSGQPAEKERVKEGGQPEQLVTPEVAPERVEGKYQELLAKVTPTKSSAQAAPTDQEAVVWDAKHIGALTDEESKVQKLLDLANAKGVAHAVKVARSLRDYYALDRMHDELADQFYQGLLEKGLIEKD